MIELAAVSLALLHSDAMPAPAAAAAALVRAAASLAAAPTEFATFEAPSVMSFVHPPLGIAAAAFASAESLAFSSSASAAGARCGRWHLMAALAARTVR